jgi:hypothetical protein
MSYRSVARMTSISVVALVFVSAVHAQVRISEVGKGSGLNVNAANGQYVELFNTGSTPVSLTGMSLQWASSPAGNPLTTDYKFDLDGTIAPGGYWLVQLTGPTNGFGIPVVPDQYRVGFNGLGYSLVAYGNSAGKVILADTTTLFTTTGCTAPDAAHVVDLVSWKNSGPSTDGCHEGSGNAYIPSPTGAGTTAVLRKCGGQTDTNENANDFVSIGRPPRNSHYTGLVDAPAVDGVTQVMGKSNRGTATGYAGQTALFTSTPSTCSGTIAGVAINLAPVGGPSAQAMYDDGTNGDVTPGDGIYSYLYTIPSPATAPLGTYYLTITATDSLSRAGTGLAPLVVAPMPPANDLCGNAETMPATVLPVNVSAWGNLVSANPITEMDTICTSSGIGTSRDVWYSFTPLESANYTVTTCNEVTAPGLFSSMSTNLTILATCPPDDVTDLTGLTLACSTNSCTSFIGGGPSTIPLFWMEADTTYLIRVAKSGNGDGIVGAPFRLDITSEPFGACCMSNGSCVTESQTACMDAAGDFRGDYTTCTNMPCPAAPAPENNDCWNPVALSPGVAVPGTSYGASGSDITTCDTTSWDVWYTFTPSSPEAFQITATRVSGSETPAIAIFPAEPCPPTTDTNLACQPATYPDSGVTSLTYTGTAGTTYLIRVATHFSQRTDFNVVLNLACNGTAGDLNGDGHVDGLDVQAFVDCALGGGSNCVCGDLDHSGTVDALDIPGFISALTP